jgi:hypothetical protein
MLIVLLDSELVSLFDDLCQHLNESFAGRRYAYAKVQLKIVRPSSLNRGVPS